MENIAFQEFQRTNQENEIVLDRGALFKMLQTSNDMSEYNQLTSVLDSMEQQIRDFTQKVDEQVLVSSEDKADTFEGAKRVNENVFDQEIQNLIQQLTQEVQNFSQNRQKNLSEFSQKMSEFFQVENFVSTLKEDTSFGMRMTAMRGGYKQPEIQESANPIESHGEAKTPLQTARDTLSGKNTHEKIDSYFN